MPDRDPSDQPVLLRVERGNPSDEELAALVLVLAARRAAVAGQDTTDVRRSGWTDRSRGLRGTHRPGPTGWRSAALPH
ncbi:MAG: acyl-CoA carboxylase subunit epsilon [Nocardioidaceae bacterium]